MIDQATRDRRPTTVNDIEWQVLGRGPRYFDVSIVPLIDGSGRTLGTSISFTDVSRVQELQTINEELRQRSDDLNRLNGFLESILTGLRSGVVVSIGSCT